MITEIAATALMMFAIHGGGGAESNGAYVMRAARSTAPFAETVDIKTIELPKEVTIESEEQPHTLETYVRSYFKETPILAEVAKCESTFRHFDTKGKILRGIENSEDVGVMQINEYYHKENAVNLGYDIYSLEGNLGYAKWLYGRYGASPWVHSSKCWGKFDKLAYSK